MLQQAAPACGVKPLAAFLSRTPSRDPKKIRQPAVSRSLADVRSPAQQFLRYCQAPLAALFHGILLIQSKKKKTASGLTPKAGALRMGIAAAMLCSELLTSSVTRYSRNLNPLKLARNSVAMAGGDA
jgi:hypothetical protein